MSARIKLKLIHGLLIVFLTVESGCRVTFAQEEDEAGPFMCLCPSGSFGKDMDSAELKSPMHPHQYCDNSDCEYEVEPGYPDQAVMLAIESFETELKHDWLEISQVFNSGGERGSMQTVRMIRLTGEDNSVTGRRFVTAVGNGFHLHFHSDGSEHRWTGFRAKFFRFNTTDPNAVKPCPPVFYETKSDSPTTLPSPERSQRLGGIPCYFKINASDSSDRSAVELSVTQMSADSEIRVYDVGDPNTYISPANSALKVFRSISAGGKVSSRSRSMLVVFHPLSHLLPLPSTAGSYFTATVAQVPNPCACKREKVKVEADKSFEVKSPGFPGDYCDNIDCDYELESANSAPNVALQISVSSFVLENNVDYLELYDTMSAARLLTSYSGIINEGTVFTFNQWKAKLRFVTDMSVVREGFNLTVKQITRDTDCKCPDRQPVEHTASTGTITFKAKQNGNNCGFMDCFWVLARPTDTEKDKKHRVILNVNYSLQLDDEWISLRNGLLKTGLTHSKTENNPEHVRLTPSITPTGDTNGSNVVEFQGQDGVVVWFHSGWSTNSDSPSGAGGGGAIETYRQFNITYEWKELCVCGKIDLAVTEQWKNLTSPDHPYDYCHNITCNYQLTAPPGTQILINITSFDTEVAEDFMGIYEGTSTSGNRMFFGSGKRFFDNPFKSKGNEVRILFTTDISIARPGWSLQYKIYTSPTKPPPTKVPEGKEEEQSGGGGDTEKGPITQTRGKSGGGGTGTLLLIIAVIVVTALTIVFVMHRKGKISLGSKIDGLLGGGAVQANSAIGYINGNSSNQGYRPFSATSQMSLVNEEE